MTWVGFRVVFRGGSTCEMTHPSPVPQRFSKRRRCRLSDDVGPGENPNDNDQSVAPHLNTVRPLFLEEEQLG